MWKARSFIPDRSRGSRMDRTPARRYGANPFPLHPFPLHVGRLLRLPTSAFPYIHRQSRLLSCNTSSSAPARHLFGAARLLAATLVLLALVGCKSFNTCDKPDAEYRQAKEQAALRVPEGMTQPDRAAALVVPPAPTRGTQPKREGCLEAPPSYFGASGRVARTPEEVVASWAQGWADRDADGVVSLYSESFEAPSGSGRGPWLGERREQIATGPVPESKLQNMQVRNEGEERRIVSFEQHFGTNVLRKELTLVREAGSWRIVAERVLDMQ